MTLKHIFLSLLAAMWAFGASAVPAKPGLLTMTQADGSEIEVRLVGDEFSHYYLSEDGYLLTTAGRDFYYADIDAEGAPVSSGIRATPAALRPAAATRFLNGLNKEHMISAMSLRREAAIASRIPVMRSRGATGDEGSLPAPVPGLLPGSDFPCFGEQKVLVILVNYSDVKMSTSDAHMYFSGLLNEPDFSLNGATGSARDYFEECSKGRFLPEFDVYGPVELPNPRAYYGKNDRYGNDENAWKMVTDACRMLDGEVDFSQYDRNHDGYIDNVFIFYAGKGEATGGGDDTVWPHSWELENAGKGSYKFDGVLVNRYACSNELVGMKADGVGTFVHEFSHVMGLPDLYATNGGFSFTPDAWSVLDYGPYNNDGHTPPLYGAFERCVLGWMTPGEIAGPLTVELSPISTNTAGIIRTASENEYFLLENRQRTGWDAYLPGHGMLVWHIHYVPSIWDANAVNNSANHQYVDLVEADDIKTRLSRAGDSFPGTAGITEFTDDTSPSMKTWEGESLGLPVTEITETPEGMITFKVAGGGEYDFPATSFLPPSDLLHTSFRANWQPVEGYRYAISLYEAASEIPVPGFDHLLTGSASSYIFTGLEPDTEYTCRVYVGNDWQFGESSEPLIVRTLPLSLDMLKVKALPATDVTTTSFTASWEALEGATDHLLSVYTLSTPEILTADCDFTDSYIPEGWTLSYEPSFSPTETYSGEAFPALCFIKGGQTLTSPVFPIQVASLSFWHMATNVDLQNRIVLSALVDDEWVKVEEYLLTRKVGGEIARFEQFPAGTKAVRFAFARGTSYGQLYIDDIHVECHDPYEKIYLEGYEERPMGSASGFNVDGLTPGTTYYYVVDATDGERRAITSDPVSVTLAEESGIDNVNAPDGVVIRASGGVIEVSGLSTGDHVIVTDLLGRTVASADAAGEMLSLPVTSGLYIVKAGTEVRKILVR